MELLDLSNEKCPLPLIKVKLWLKQAEIGESVRVKLSDKGSRQDIPKFLRAIGQQVVIKEQAEFLLIQICKLNQNLSVHTDLAKLS